MIIRAANKEDLYSIKSITQFGPYVHQHLDWFQPIDWIGCPPFYVVERNFQLIAALACPLVPGEAVWIRLFTANDQLLLQDLWQGLWARVVDFLSPTHSTIAAISHQKWFQGILGNNGFSTDTDVVLLQWERGNILFSERGHNIKIRKMQSNDLKIAAQIDHDAFDLIWRNSESSLEKALSLSAYATVAEDGDKIVGYQISSAKPSNAHLARLAVLPKWQGRGIGSALVQDLLTQFELWGTLRVTVNTQKSNVSSLSVYEKAGFQLEKDIYPVFKICL